jgi:hypothetical protein
VIAFVSVPEKLTLLICFESACTVFHNENVDKGNVNDIITYVRPPLLQMPRPVLALVASAALKYLT